MLRVLSGAFLFLSGFGSGVYLGRQGVLHDTAYAQLHRAHSEEGVEPQLISRPVKQSVIALPIAGLKRADIIDTYDDLRGGKRKHEATDIMAPHGTPVVAAVDGTIAKLFYSDGGGGTTIYQFDRESEHAYYYAHLSGYRAGLKEGDKVKRGEVIAYVGSTGNASPDAPHLHFAIFELGPEKQWWRGTPINPYPLLVDALDAANSKGS